MANADGGFSVTSPGVVTISLGYQPDHLRFSAGPRGTSSGKVQYYVGTVDSSGYQGCFGTFGEGSNLETVGRTTNTRCVLIREYVVGTGWVTRVEASFHSFVATGFKLNVITGDTSFPLWVESSN